MWVRARPTWYKVRPLKSSFFLPTMTYYCCSSIHLFYQNKIPYNSTKYTQILLIITYTNTFTIIWVEFLFMSLTRLINIIRNHVCSIFIFPIYWYIQQNFWELEICECKQCCFECSLFLHTICQNIWTNKPCSNIHFIAKYVQRPHAYVNLLKHFFAKYVQLPHAYVNLLKQFYVNVKYS